MLNLLLLFLSFVVKLKSSFIGT